MASLNKKVERKMEGGEEKSERLRKERLRRSRKIIQE